MMKLTALYTPPTDPEAFEAHYLSQHAPLVDAIPGLVRQETAMAVGTPDGSPPVFYRIADLYFASMEALGAGFASEQGRATAADAAALAERTGCTITFLVCAVD